MKIPFDVFLYNLCHLPVYNERENVDDEAIREEFHIDNEKEEEEDEVVQDLTQFSVLDPYVY